MERRGWTRARDIAARAALVTVVFGALIVRLIVWRLMGGPIIRGDGSAYIEWAQRLAAGDLSGFQDFPLHQLYPILIAPAFKTGAAVAPYLLVLHAAMSIGTVLCLYYACRQFSPRPVAVAAAAAAAVYPALLFWSPYVLSETPFFFFLSLFLAALAHFLSRSGARRPTALMSVGVIGVLVLFARPVSVAILGVSAVAVAYALLSGRMGARPARVVALVGVLFAVSALMALLSLDTPVRQKLLHYPTVAQSLWLSTRYSSISIAEWTPVLAEHRALAERFAGDPDALWDYKVSDAIDFIRAHPGTYGLLAVRRFASYWLPAFFADGWSASHRLFDLLLSVALYTGAIASLYRRRDLVRWTLFAGALALGILTSFSQIDTDGRYRVPAELVLLLLATDGYARLLSAGRERWQRRAASRLVATEP